MTDKLKLFKVRLASGAERYIVAPDLVAVAQLRFERPASGSIDAGVDPVKGVEEDVDVDFVILREPQDGVTPPPAAIIEKLSVGSPCPQCGGILHATLGQLTCNLGHQVGPVPDGTFHNHASTVDGRLSCKACQNEAPRDIAGDANRRMEHTHMPGLHSMEGCPACDARARVLDVDDSQR